MKERRRRKGEVDGVEQLFVTSEEEKEEEERQPSTQLRLEEPPRKFRLLLVFPSNMPDVQTAADVWNNSCFGCV